MVLQSSLLDFINSILFIVFVITVITSSIYLFFQYTKARKISKENQKILIRIFNKLYDK